MDEALDESTFFTYMNHPLDIMHNDLCQESNNIERVEDKILHYFENFQMSTTIQNSSSIDKLNLVKFLDELKRIDEWTFRQLPIGAERCVADASSLKPERHSF